MRCRGKPAPRESNPTDSGIWTRNDDSLRAARSVTSCSALTEPCVRVRAVPKCEGRVACRALGSARAQATLPADRGTSRPREPRETRTPDILGVSEALYQLSYRSIRGTCPAQAAPTLAIPVPSPRLCPVGFHCSSNAYAHSFARRLAARPRARATVLCGAVVPSERQLLVCDVT